MSANSDPRLAKDPSAADGATLLSTLLARPYIGESQPPDEPPATSATRTTSAPAQTVRIVAKLTREGYELEAEVKLRKGRGVLVTNGSSEVWLPSAHVYRSKPLLVSEWIGDNRSRDFHLIDPDNWAEANRRERKAAPRGAVWFPDVE